MLNMVIGFVSGIGIALVSALLNTSMQSRKRKKRELEKSQTDIYYRLMMLRTLWWGMVLAESRGEALSSQDRREIHDTAWKLADVLREADDINDLGDIVAVIFSEGFETAQARYDAMERIISRLGYKTNPKYNKAVARVSAANMNQGTGALDRMFSAPAAFL